MKLKVAVAGCTGYAGGEVLRLLSGRQDIEIGAVTAHSSAGGRLGERLPHLPGLASRVIEDTRPDILADHDVVILALPHGASAELAAALGDVALILDCGADFRLRSARDWERYYGSGHPGTWPYGLPELPGQRAVLAAARRIAVPGCYPTASTLALAPAVASGLSDGRDIVIVAASGASGAGKTLKPHLLGAELMGSASAYGVGGVHRHVPEIIQNLRFLGAEEPTVSFTPVLVPMPRGILATCTAPVAPGLTTELAYDVYAEFYADEPFVTVLPPGVWPQSASVIGSNAVCLQVAVDQAAGRLVAVAALDNLVKGTAGGAMQCLNLALGLDETTGLTVCGVAP
ncbi:MAG: N-acetyl-gamma-glutamyl-phosphate reductase [Propionibacteriaceae bacterium]|nr:N-acetyl-gamma-glutamyl-phosphate reductase [Propionibacteriaceae bacterium]